MVENLVELEREFFLLLNSPHTPYMDSVMYVISAALPWIIFIILFVAFISVREDKREILLVLLGLLLLVLVADGISSGIIKPIFQRHRPTHHPLTQDDVLTVLNYRGGNYGFISGHTTNFFAFAAFSSLVVRNRWYSIMSHVVAATVAYSRIYLGVHFITDVIPGLIVGTVTGWLIYLLYRESRITFLEVPRDQASQSYLPQKRGQFIAYLMTIYYVLIWVTAPLLITIYQ